MGWRTELMADGSAIVRHVLQRATVLLCAAMAFALAPAEAGDVKAAVAANFADPVREIATRFEAATGHKLIVSIGATGQFYAQIVQGAPFDVLLAADTETPAKAIAAGNAVAGSGFTYAVGSLVLYSRDARLVDGEATLRTARFAKIAIANPATAPYGRAAVETMTALGVYDQLRPKIVQGASIAQAFQFVDTGNAEVGFVALSQVIEVRAGSRWLVPRSLHAPIEQGAVLLNTGVGNAAAAAFMAFLKGPEARAVIEKYGYRTGS